MIKIEKYERVRSRKLKESRGDTKSLLSFCVQNIDLIDDYTHELDELYRRVLRDKLHADTDVYFNIERTGDLVSDAFGRIKVDVYGKYTDILKTVNAVIGKHSEGVDPVVANLKKKFGYARGYVFPKPALNEYSLRNSGYTDQMLIGCLYASVFNKIPDQATIIEILNNHKGVFHVVDKYTFPEFKNITIVTFLNGKMAIKNAPVSVVEKFREIIEFLNK